MWRPQYTVCVVVTTGGQSSNKVEPSSVIVMLLSVYTHLTIVETTYLLKTPGGILKYGYRIYSFHVTMPTKSSPVLNRIILSCFFMI